MKNYSVSATHIFRPYSKENDGDAFLTATDKFDLNEYTYYHTVSYKKMKEWKPDIILMMIGNNFNYIDHPNKFKRDYPVFIKSLQDIESKPELYLLV